MEVSDKEMRQMVKAAWDLGYLYAGNHYWSGSKRSKRSSREQDVTRILEAKKKEQRKDGRDEANRA